MTSTGGTNISSHGVYGVDRFCPCKIKSLLPLTTKRADSALRSFNKWNERISSKMETGICNYMTLNIEEKKIYFKYCTGRAWIFLPSALLISIDFFFHSKHLFSTARVTALAKYYMDRDHQWMGEILQLKKISSCLVFLVCWELTITAEKHSTSKWSWDGAPSS